MKFVKYALMVCALASLPVQAETIESSGGFGGYIAPTNSAAKFCIKLAFIKRNAGTLVTGLTATNLKVFRLAENSLNSLGQQVSNPFNVTFTLAASTVPVQAGVYDLCMTPKAPAVWKKTTALPGGYTYYLEAVVVGPTVGDNGLLTLFLN